MQKHHAYLLYGESLQDSVLHAEFKVQSSDVLHVIRDRFAIDDARELSRIAQQKPFEARERVIVIVTKDIAIEAQNALLKLFEEPPAHIQFYLIIRRTAFVLPTLLSRLSKMIDDTQMSSHTKNETFALFSSLSYKDKLEQIADKTKEKDLEWIEAIVSGSETYATLTEKNKESLLKTVVFIRTYIGTRGASSKMLLEELALSLPLK